MALTSDHIKAMETSWEEVCKNLTNNGIDLYVMYFTAFPQYQDYFKDMKGVPLDELKSKKNVRVHGTRVMHALSSIVTTLDELDVAAGIMVKIVERHVDYDVKVVTAYEDMFSIFPAYMEKHAGDTFNEVAREGWTTALGLLVDASREKLDEMDKQKAA